LLYAILLSLKKIKIRKSFDTTYTSYHLYSLLLKSASPDELALLQFAKFCGFKYFGMDKDQNMTIKYKKNNRPCVEKYQLLDVLSFNSTRKRMSVILKDPDTGKIWLHSKGADNVILERCQEPINKKEETIGCLDDFASHGLRTLAVASRIIPETEYVEWSKEYKEAKLSLEDRKKKMMAVQEKIEV